MRSGSAKGSIKDRVRFWKMKLRKKNKEKKYNKLQVFGLTILGLFLGLFTPQKNKQTKDIKKIIEECMQLNNQIKEVTDEKILKIYSKDIQKKEKQLENLNLKVRSSNIKKEQIEINKCKDLIKEAKTFIEYKKQKHQSIVLGDQMKKEEIINNPVEEKIVIVKKQPFTLEDKINDETKPNDNILHESNDNILYEFNNDIIKEKIAIKLKDYLHYLNETNKKIKFYKDDIKKLKNKLKEERKENELHKIEYEYELILSKLYLLEKEYLEVSSEKEFNYLNQKQEYYSLDKNNLLINDKQILELIDTVKKEIEVIKEKTKTKQNIQEKKQPKKDKTVNQYIDISDHKAMCELIKKDLNNISNQIIDVKQNNNKLLFGKFKNFIIITSLLVLPPFLFKNKLIGILTGSTLLQNRIKAMNKIVDDKYEENYETLDNINDIIKNKQDCLNQIKKNLTNSLSELNKVKNKFISRYCNQDNPEIDSIMEEFNKLEITILSKEEELSFQNQSFIRRSLQKKEKIKVRKL